MNRLATVESAIREVPQKKQPRLIAPVRTTYPMNGMPMHEKFCFLFTISPLRAPVWYRWCPVPRPSLHGTTSFFTTPCRSYSQPRRLISHHQKELTKGGRKRDDTCTLLLIASTREGNNRDRMLVASFPVAPSPLTFILRVAPLLRFSHPVATRVWNASYDTVLVAFHRDRRRGTDAHDRRRER